MFFGRLLGTNINAGCQPSVTGRFFYPRNHFSVQISNRYRSHNNIFRRVAIYDLNRFVGNPHIGTTPLRRFQMRRNAWIPVRLSTATDAVLLRSHEANGAAVGWLPWVREELCVSCRLDCRARPSRESFPPGSVGPLATMAGALLMSDCSFALR